jgi:hypothetical protein
MAGLDDADRGAEDFNQRGRDMTDDEMNAAIAALPGEKVTKDAMEARIVDTAFIRIGATVTVCSLTLDNGYSVRGESACVDAVNYNQEIGEKLARDQAFAKLWPLFGFLLSEIRFVRRT